MRLRLFFFFNTSPSVLLYWERIIGKKELKKTHTPAKRSHDITFQEMYKRILKKKRMDYYLSSMAYSIFSQLPYPGGYFRGWILTLCNITEHLRLAWHPAVLFLFLQWRCEVNGSIVASDWLPLSKGYIIFLQSSTKEKGWHWAEPLACVKENEIYMLQK